jgi:hypothetical protein
MALSHFDNQRLPPTGIELDQTRGLKAWLGTDEHQFGNPAAKAQIWSCERASVLSAKFAAL